MLKDIAFILQPPAWDHSFSMITGYDGAGKTTLVRQVGQEHAGIIYVNILSDGTSDEEFGNTFAQALRWSPRSHSWVKEFLGMPGLREEEMFGMLLT